MDRLAPTPRRGDGGEHAAQRMGARTSPATCLFLGSDAARYVSGAILPADGGWILNGAPMGLGAV